MGAPRAFWGSIAMAHSSRLRGPKRGAEARSLARSAGRRGVVFVVAFVPRSRQANPEDAAPSRRRLDLDLAAVAANDFVGDRKAKAGAFSDALGGKKRIEDPIDHLRRDATTVILDAEHHLVALAPHHHADRTLPLDRLAGIQDQIDQHLLDLLRRAVDARDRRELFLDAYPQTQLRRGHAQGALHEGPGVGHAALRPSGVREASDVAHDRGNPVDAFERLEDELLALAQDRSALAV